jgi:hypothetical protein
MHVCLHAFANLTATSSLTLTRDTDLISRFHFPESTLFRHTYTPTNLTIDVGNPDGVERSWSWLNNGLSLEIELENLEFYGPMVFFVVAFILYDLRFMLVEGRV